MDPVTMAAIAAAMSAGQGYLSSRGKKKQLKKYNKRFQRSIGATEALQGRSLSQQEALSRQATKQQLGGYDTARREASRLGRGGKRAALDRETQLLGSASQGLASSGLGGTTIGANLQRGIASDTNRQMSSIDEGLAGIYGNLALGRAGAESAGTQQLGQFAGQRGDLLSQLSQMRNMKDMYSATPWGGSQELTAPIPGIGENLMTGVQTGLGAYMGMGGGGGMGGMGGGNSAMMGASGDTIGGLYDLENDPRWHAEQRRRRTQGLGHNEMYGPFMANTMGYSGQ